MSIGAGSRVPGAYLHRAAQTLHEAKQTATHYLGQLVAPDLHVPCQLPASMESHVMESHVIESHAMSCETAGPASMESHVMSCETAVKKGSLESPPRSSRAPATPEGYVLDDANVCIVHICRSKQAAQFSTRNCFSTSISTRKCFSTSIRLRCWGATLVRPVPLCIAA
jgi:hypothetical protein